MKKITSLSNKSFFRIWLIYHSLILLAFVAVFFANGRKITIDSDLFNMMPKPAMKKALSAADEKLTQMSGQNMFILASNEDFSKAKEAAIELYEKMISSDKFENVSLYQDLSAMNETINFVEKNRTNLLGKNDILLLENGGAEQFAENALGKVYGSFTMTNLSNIEKDPFLLSENALENYLAKLSASGTSMSLKDGVLASFVKPEGIDGIENARWYVMIRSSLSKKGSVLASHENGVEFLNQATSEIESRSNGETHFVFSGTPFHSYKASSNASTEISVISTVSILIVVVILLFVFRSPLPIFASVSSILVSILAAFMATISVFGKMHVLTLVFGTSLIGSCIDYSLHFFINWKANLALKSGAEIRTFLFKGLSLSLLSTVLCYFVLLFAPFNLLRQMSVFSSAGILSTFLTAVCVYPMIKIPSEKRTVFGFGKYCPNVFRKPKQPSGNVTTQNDLSNEKKKHLAFSDSFRQSASKRIIGRCGIAAMFVFCVATLLITGIAEKNAKTGVVSTMLNHQTTSLNPSVSAANVFGGNSKKKNPLIKFFRIENNIGRLYKMEGKEFQNEKEAAQILKYSPSAWFIVSGESVQKTLENEEKVTRALEKINAGKEKSGYVCTSLFVPSVASQKKSRAAAEKLLPLAKQQFLLLGYSETEAETLSRKLEDNFYKTSDDFIEIGKNVPGFIEESVKSAWIGEIDGKYYSVVLPVSVTDYDAYKSIADNEDIFMISKVREINEDLDSLSCTIIAFFVIVYVVIFVVLKFFYNWKESLKIISVPILIVLSISAVFALLKIRLEFFSITGMILVFGLGLDYIIYMVEDERRNKNRKNENCKNANNPADANREIVADCGNTNCGNSERNTKNRLESFAVLLSFVTTAVSFGALALSKFVPVQMIGLSIFVGLTAAFVSTVFYTMKDD